MPGPSPEQQRIIDDTSRIRIVRAAPGSGKTWLVGKIIQKELETWTNSGGIAALSFTRVGGEEIRNAVGYELTSPHFVGTLDSFLFRYIVKPFWNKIHPDFAIPHLIPAESGVEKWTKPPQQDIKLEIPDKVTRKPYNLQKINYNGISASNKPILTYPKSFSGEYEIMNPDMSDWAWKEKWKIIKKLGWMTHADVALCSYKILSNQQYGERVSKLIAKRFSFLIIDEMQDTGYFAGQSILQLLEKATDIKTLLVGDPNQAIYEFNGATPSLFDQFSKLSKSHNLAQSRRCPQSIVSLANCLFPAAMNSNDEENGKNTLIIYSNFEKDIPEFITEINKLYSYQNIKYITRLNKTIYDFSKKKKKDLSTLGCPALTLMSHAVQAFYQGSNVKAFGLAESAISLWLFKYEGITEEDLSIKQVIFDDWKELIVSCLLDCVKINEFLTYEKWQTEAGAKIEERIKNSSLQTIIPTNHLKPKNYKKGRDKRCCDEQMTIFFPSLRKKTDVPLLQTIHSVKGQTHDATVLVIPPISRGKNQCPSDLWWSEDLKDSEERRIAYVALTRSRKDLYLVVSKETAKNLENKRPTFFNCFEVKQFKSPSQA